MRRTEFTKQALIVAVLGSGLLSYALPMQATAQEQGEAEQVTADEAAPHERPLTDPDSLREGEAAIDLLNAPGLSRGVDAIIAEIRKREVELAKREQGVAERERAVIELEAMIEKRAIDLDRIRQEIEDRIASWSEQGRDRVAQLADVYSAMPSARAGALLNKLELDLATSVVRSMKKKQSAAVMAAMRPDRALLVSRRMLKPLDPKTDDPAARAR